jgi:hypothetical protein
MSDRTQRLLLPPGLLLVVLVLHHQLLLHGGLLGAVQSDVIRGVWGLDHQARGLPLPLWSDRVGFPEGVKLLVLPWLSSQLAAPLVWLLGAVAAYDLWMLTLLWASGLSAGLLARQLTGQPLSGWLAGCMVIASPMLWLAITDGTPENVAFWTVPLFLAALWRAVRGGGPRWGAAAGLLAVAVAADSPYHAVFAAMMSPLALTLPRPLSPALLRSVGALALVCTLGAAGLLGMYAGLPVHAAPDSSDVGNAVQMVAWLQWERGDLASPWEWTLVPNFIPLLILAPAALLALARPLRAGPWLGMAALMLLLSLGPGQENPRLLGQVLGAWVVGPLSSWADLLAAHPPPVIRFLRRFLVPATLCLGVAAELGLARLPALSRLSPLLGLLAVAITWQKAGYPSHLPRTEPPQTAACAFVAGHPAQGAILVLPQVRAAHRLHQRDELPVFANLGSSVQSAAELWLQVQCERPSMNQPTGLLTMVPRIGRSEDLRVLLRDLDDLTVPQTLGRAMPPSIRNDPDRKTRTVDWLVREGLSFVVVDEEVYGEEGLALLRDYFFPAHLVEERSFDDGTGITVLVLAPSEDR